MGYGMDKLKFEHFQPSRASNSSAKAQLSVQNPKIRQTISIKIFVSFRYM